MQKVEIWYLSHILIPSKRIQTYWEQLVFILILREQKLQQDG